MLRRQSILRAMLFRGVSAFAVCAVATGGQAWAQEASKKADSSVIEEVVVTARRAAIESAQERKKHAEVIVDSVVASFSVEGSNLANKIVETSMGGYPDDRKYIRSWFDADRRANASLQLSF